MQNLSLATSLQNDGAGGSAALAKAPVKELPAPQMEKGGATLQSADAAVFQTALEQMERLVATVTKGQAESGNALKDSDFLRNSPLFALVMAHVLYDLGYKQRGKAIDFWQARQLWPQKQRQHMIGLCVQYLKQATKITPDKKLCARLSSNSIHLGLEQSRIGEILENDAYTQKVLTTTLHHYYICIPPFKHLAIFRRNAEKWKKRVFFPVDPDLVNALGEYMAQSTPNSALASVHSQLLFIQRSMSKSKDECLTALARLFYHNKGQSFSVDDLLFVLKIMPRGCGWGTDGGEMQAREFRDAVIASGAIAKDFPSNTHVNMDMLALYNFLPLVRNVNPQKVSRPEIERQLIAVIDSAKLASTSANETRVFMKNFVGEHLDRIFSAPPIDS